MVFQAILDLVYLDILVGQEYLAGLVILVLVAHQALVDSQELVGILGKMVNLAHLVTQDIADQVYLGIADIRAFLDIAVQLVNLDILEDQVLVDTQELMGHLDTQESAVTAVLV